MMLIPDDVYEVFPVGRCPIGRSAKNVIIFMVDQPEMGFSET